MIEGYCVKCKAKRPIADAVEEHMKNGRKAVKGKCPVCGAVMFKILGGKATVSLPAAPGSSSPSGAASAATSGGTPPAPSPSDAPSNSPSSSTAAAPTTSVTSSERDPEPATG